mgnify:CR=1 FL=1
MVHYKFATDEQRQLADGARLILEKELKPRIEEIEKTGGFPRDVVKSLADAGYSSISIPERWGGLGFDNRTQAIIYEEMAQIDAGFSFSYALAAKPSLVLEYTGISKEEKQKWFDRTMAGEVIWATALTEPDAGSDTRAIRATAVQDGNEWVLNGTKCFITNGGVADVFVVSAYYDKSKGSAGIGQFVVEKERGVKIGKIEDKMGLKLSVTAEVILEDVRVPLSHMVGSIFMMDPKAAKELPKVEMGNKGVLAQLADARITTMVHSLGIGQAALDHAVEYAKVRRTFGSRIIDHQGLGFLIADMQMKVDAARALLYYSIDCLDAGLDTGTLSPSTKVFISDNMMQVALDAIQVMGGYGYMKEYPVEKLARDAKIFAIFEGTNEINKMVSVRTLAGRDPEKVKK